MLFLCLSCFGATLGSAYGLILALDSEIPLSGQYGMLRIEFSPATCEANKCLTHYALAPTWHESYLSTMCKQLLGFCKQLRGGICTHFQMQRAISVGSSFLANFAAKSPQKELSCCFQRQEDIADLH